MKSRKSYFIMKLFIVYISLGSNNLTCSSELISHSLNLASTAFDKLCTSTLPIHSMIQPDTPDMEKLFLRHMTACRNYSVPLDKANQLLNHKLFSKTKKTIIFSPGWRNTVERSDAIAMMANAFFERNDVNFVVVDVATYLDTMYKWAALNTEKIGKQIAIGLSRLEKVIPLANIHLVGHSLGAHIMGAAGRYFNILRPTRRLQRITGLDPAKPCFGDEFQLASLRRGDARIVDVIHTNSGVLGVWEPIGNIDFYPNGLNWQQPGCTMPDCAHSRALEYWIDTINTANTTDFPTYKCATLENLERLKCSKRMSTTQMGFYLGRQISTGIFNVDVSNYASNRKNTIARSHC